MKKTFFAFLFAVLLAGALCFAAACAKIPDATDPPDGTDPPAGESPGPIPGVDCHIKLGDTAYDFTAGMPDGVTADTSAVNFQAAGAYTILYKRDGSDNLEKKAYVYGMPAFSFEREAIGSNVYPLTYFEARHIDWGGVSALGVSAADSFGTSLDVAAQVLDAYDGDYGSYRVRYEATDAAGNVAESVAAYAVAGTNQPTVADASFDLSGAAAQIPVAWGGAAEALLYYGGTLVDGGLYGEGQGGITIPAATFNALDPDGDSYDFRIETDLWYEEFTVSVTDAAAPLFEVPPGGYIFAPVPSLALPLARKTSEQRFTLSYAAGGGLSVSAGANGLTLTKTGGGAIPAGDYTVTVKAMRGSSQDGTGTVSFTVYAAEAFGRAVAPLVNNQYAGVIGQYNSNYGGFAFDAAAGAYRYVKNASPYTEYDPAKIICAASSVPGGKLLADHTEYSAFVFDIYYDDLNTDGKDLIFLFGKAGFMRDGSVAQITETATSASVAYADIAQDVWYTVSVPMTGSFTAYNGFISLFSAFGNAAYNFLVRNMRFQAERIGGGYIYQTDVNKLYELPALGQENPICSVMRDGDNEVTLTDGNKLKLSAAGEYTAAIGTETISFTVYTEDAFGAAVAPLTNGQYEGAFYQFDPSYGGFIFDAAAGAYRYVRKADSYTVTFPPAIVCKTASVPGGKLLANNGGYTAFVFDIYYNT
ncbi:MAG: hypothetical protein LBL66_01845, partial [Clostridiales bacterium]|nr:hypothetical protein [Clostridiales bacterium]